MGETLGDPRAKFRPDGLDPGAVRLARLESLKIAEMALHAREKILAKRDFLGGKAFEQGGDGARDAPASSAGQSTKASRGVRARAKGAASRSSGSSAAPTRRSVAASRANQPMTSREGASGTTPFVEIAPCEGRKPKIPQNDAGARQEPAVSVPSAKSASPAATATAEPEDDPRDDDRARRD